MYFVIAIFILFLLPFQASAAQALPAAAPDTQEQAKAIALLEERVELMAALRASGNKSFLENSTTPPDGYDPAWPLIRTAKNDVFNDILEQALKGYDATTPRGYIPLLSALVEASSQGCLANVKLLLCYLQDKEPYAFPALINLPVRTPVGKHFFLFPLHAALRSGHAACALHLLEKGCNPKKRMILEGDDDTGNAWQQILKRPVEERQPLLVLLGAHGYRDELFVNIIRKNPELAKLLGRQENCDAAFWDYRPFGLLIQANGKAINTYLHRLPQEILTPLHYFLIDAYSRLDKNTVEWINVLPYRKRPKRKFDFGEDRLIVENKITDILNNGKDITKKIDPYYRSPLVLLSSCEDCENLIQKILAAPQPESIRIKTILKSLQRTQFDNSNNHRLLIQYLRERAPTAFSTLLTLSKNIRSESYESAIKTMTVNRELTTSRKKLADGLTELERSKKELAHLEIAQDRANLNLEKAEFDLEKQNLKADLLAKGAAIGMMGGLLGPIALAVGIVSLFLDTIGYLKDGSPVLGKLLPEPHGNIIGYTDLKNEDPIYLLTPEEKIKYPDAIGKTGTDQIIYAHNPLEIATAA